MTNQELESIYDIHFKKIYRYFYYRVVNKEIAQDLTSDTFISFIDSVKISDKKIRNLTKYLYGVARITFCEYLKDKYMEPNFVEFDNAPDFEDTVTTSLDKIDEKKTPEEVLLMYLHRLPEKQKIIIKLRLLDKLSLKEITQKLGKDMNYVKTTQKRAIKNLKLLWENNYCTPD
jgi:RNA polymerase sigma-70 factor (ECF subfamily)